ncbi:WhiB family redox-sensing transcriptional regulator [Jatrophihabitans sp. GAS493]|uniref:WhiB family transcriptional regulator n=1 Tax=Jatrophihabitans sp. GAS493 TaxID=1907575 RepID=UPI000BB7E0FD|nr:WhiB family transcriptional regulator [Jatrophihabitans sp. GAS493]SOD73189.1 WhiB family redox-sensing transcriptional regulator [Jatrophihabitans sp. GAS493]
MTLSCLPTDDITSGSALELAHTGLVLDPLSPSCPADLPCQVRDADLWFADTPVQLEAAKALCQDCPVRQACLAGALERREPWGVWGGEIFDHGVVLARKRGRGRPRKSDQDVAA